MSKLKNILSKIVGSSLAIVIGFLGAFAGSSGTSKSWRRICIPVIFTVSAFIYLKSFWVIMLMSMAGWLSCGYGIPDDNYPENVNTDSGSTIGRFFTMFFRKYFDRQKAHKVADYFTRGTVGCLISLSFLIVPILKGNWIVYILGALVIVLVYSLISWRDFGTFIFKWKNKTYYLLKVDFVTYGVLGVCGLFIIYKG